MDKIVELGEKSMTLRANALLPRKYRHLFNRDLISDMRKLHDDYRKSNGETFDPEVFENLAWLMFREGGESVGGSPEEWLAGMDDMMALYRILPVVVELWGANLQTTAKPKKK